jgi:FkbM family methyltransferase
MFKINAHHVGARGYGISLNLPEIFWPDITHVLYEADADAVKQMALELSSEHARMLSEKYVLPYCLGRRNGSALLNITRNSYASSLFSPNKEFYQYYCEIPIDNAVYDISYESMLEVVSQVKVEVHSLDELLASGRVPLAHAPDFLSLDTQGFELQVLEGASKAISDSVLGIISEVEMMPMYIGQPLFGDILKFATDHGFIFAGFTNQFDVSPLRAPIGVRGKAFPGFGDVLFLRNLNTLTEDNFSVDSLYVKLRKLAFISASFGFIEYALASTNAAEKLRERVSCDLVIQVGKYNYSKFLDEMISTVSKMDKIFPPIHAVPDDSRSQGDTCTSWYNKYHQSAIKHYSTIQADLLQFNSLREYAKQSRFVRVIYRMLPVGLARRLRMQLFPETITPSSQTQHVKISSVSTYTSFEKLLENWGFADTSYIVRQRRLLSEPYVRSLSPEMLEAGKYANITTS